MKSIRGFKGLYSVTRDGRVWSHPKRVGDRGYHSGKYLKPWVQNCGYFVITLYKGKRKYNFLLHRIVASAYIRNPRHKPEVNHKDTDRTNNHAKNLEWCTSKENKKHAWGLGLYDNVRNRINSHK